MTAKKIFCAFSVHVDAVAGYLGSYGGEDSPCDISRGVFGGEVGTPRLVELFRRFGLKTSWFIPGHSIESFPNEMAAVAAAGHEIGLHGYSHENPIAMSRDQEAAVLDRCIELTRQLTGRRPRGYVAPWWEFSPNTADLLIERQFLYDNSLMHHDFLPYYLRTGDRWAKIDYSQSADTWMKPFERGTLTDLVEIPGNWYLDDLPPMMFVKAAPNSHGYVSPQAVEQLWRDQFDWVYREMDYAVFSVTIHPDVSGRPQVLLMLERLIAHMLAQPGVQFATLEDIAEDFKQRSPRPDHAVAQQHSAVHLV